MNGRGPRWISLLSVCFLSFIGCKTASRGDGASSPQGVELLNDDSLALGPVRDPRLKELFYQAVEGTLAAKDSTAEGEEVSTELGELDSFRFTVIRLTQAGGDVSGDVDGKPDGMDVEISGWYKRTQSLRPERRTADTCGSFDVRIAAVKLEGLWQLRDKIPLSLGREDVEDCY